MIETQEDIYVGSIETDRGVREQVRFYDTRGLRDGQPSLKLGAGP